MRLSQCDERVVVGGVEIVPLSGGGGEQVGQQPLPLRPHRRVVPRVLGLSVL